MEKNKNLNNKNYIEYSTKIFDSINKERPSFILKDLEVKNDKGDINRILAIILKYKINSKEQEAVIGTIQNTTDRTEKAKTIIQYLTEQFHENFDEKPGFDGYYKLMQYKKKDGVPFELTVEGTNMLAIKDKNNVQIAKTFSDNGNGKMNKIFVDEDIEIMKKQKNIEMLKYIKEKEQEKKWNARRKKILNQLEKESKEEKQKFINGEKITKFINDTNEDNDKKRELVGDYLVECFESNDVIKNNLANGYAQMQEKAYAINVRVALEEQRDKCYKLIQIEQDKQNVNEVQVGKILNLIDNINEYLNLFELIKEKRNWNANFTYKAKKMDFKEVKRLCEIYDPNDKEIVKYLDLKEKTLSDEKLNKSGKENEYKDSETMQNLDEFLVKSCVQDYTKPSDLYSAKNVVIENGKYMVKKIYDHLVREMVDYNSDILSVYNKYAEKSGGVKTYSVDEHRDKEREFSKIVKKVSKKIIEDEKIHSNLDDNASR